MTGREHGPSPPREGGGEETSSLEFSPEVPQVRPGIVRSLSAGDVMPLHIRSDTRPPAPIAERNIFTGTYRTIIPYPGAWHVVSRSEEEEETYYRSPPEKVATPTPAPRTPVPAPRKKRELSEDSEGAEQDRVRRDLRPSPQLSVSTTPSPPQGSSSPRQLAPTPQPPLPQRPRNPHTVAARIRETSPTVPTPQIGTATASTSYAAAAASTSRERIGSKTPPPPPSSPPPAQTQAKDKTYPPIVVEALPAWTEHFAALNKLLGHPPNGRPFGKGVRFIPKSPEEYRTIQGYLIKISTKERPIAWHSYTPAAEQPIKIAIRGLPGDTPKEEIEEEMKRLGFPLQHLKRIPPRRERPGCLFHAQVERQPNEDLTRLYGITQMLYMSGITIEAWRGRKGPSQCHRCQAFGHSSENCHRTPKCVRCGEVHVAAECERPKSDKPTCANCQGPHTANDKRCPHYKREARKMGIKPQPDAPPKPSKKQEVRERQRGEVKTTTPGDVTPTKPTARAVAGAISTLMPPANPAPKAGPRKSRNRKRRPKNKKKTVVPEAGEGAAQVRATAHESEPSAKSTTVPQTQPAESRGAVNKNIKITNAASQRTPPAQPAAVPWNMVHGMLMDILSALTTGADLLPVVLRGLATLTSVQHEESA